LGGARPKANILDEHKQLWIAKFPSKNDTVDKAAWEYVGYQLAIKAGINMSESKISKVLGNYHTFFTKRFDRQKNERIHFASAMTLTGNNEEILRNSTASYLDIAEVIQQYGANVKQDLAQLWKRIVFNTLISNTDDHLRNHGFILCEKGWLLSPAYDINPSVDKNGLSLNIDLDNNDLDIELVKSVGAYFRLSLREMDKIIEEVNFAVKQWREIANKIGISRAEQELMSVAFLVS
jgi:serine/threonine-protein kinase HipA